MNIKTRSLTLSALFSALAIIIIYLASLWPTGQIGLTAVAALLVAAAIIESGIVAGISVYIVSSVISFLIVTDRIAPLLFIFFFGHYPVVKCIIEKRSNLVFQIFAKFVVFNLSLTIFLIVFGMLVKWLFGNYSAGMLQLVQSFDFSIVLIYIVGNIIFYLYDYGFTKLILFYKERISNVINKKNK